MLQALLAITFHMQRWIAKPLSLASRNIHRADLRIPARAKVISARGLGDLRGHKGNDYDMGLLQLVPINPIDTSGRAADSASYI